MDWQNPTDDKRVVLAITRLRATTHVDYRGPLIMNPGGPGGSGVFALRDRGAYLQSIVGDNYDIISFDPRGVGASTPRHQCFASTQDEDAWELQEPRNLIGAHSGVIPELYARSIAYSQLCEANMAATGLLEHAGSVAIARDMLEIVTLAFPDGLLRYWGFSWGTILGGIFAAMYPDRVDRIVNDGNVDYREWFRAEHRNFPRDTEKCMDAFYTSCYDAGPDSCEMYADSPDAIRARLDALFESLKEEPVIVPPVSMGGAGPSMPMIITHSKLRGLQYSALYRPADQFASLAHIAAALERGDGLPFYEHFNPPPDDDDDKESTPSTPLCGAPELTPFDPQPGLIEGNKDAFSAIRCSDYTPSTLGDLSREDVRRQADEILRLSPSTGALNALHALVCIGRRTHPKWTYDGPLGGTTRHPILFLANSADNITPLVSARNNSAGFPGSVVLVQKGYGHTSLAAPSDCANSHVRAYFQNGTLPDQGTECEGQWAPFAKALEERALGKRSRAVSTWWL
ncbi:TAP-like protein-domain-containing protein [Plectosphaerella plurivora]|uniref:TAP-like protein-domain-containing protein n=1 Tax=Plectosphaerella plurivora TaxID=936078 RepID=A0A9P8VIT0_9PEZI|nr:TAP-like protein-domain-containing protein [Plectosphaerella plurivora]